MNDLRVWWASAVYDCEEMLYQTREEAIENAWMNDEANVFPVVEKSAYDALKAENQKLREELYPVELGLAKVVSNDLLDMLTKDRNTIKNLRSIISKFLEHSRECADDYDYVYGDIVTEANAILEKP